jgi:hypothetical protein
MQPCVSGSAPGHATHQTLQELYLQLEARQIRFFTVFSFTGYPLSRLRRPTNFPEPLYRQFCVTSLPDSDSDRALRLP